ncbi:DUF2170 domain-containing protein [Comamonas sp. JNW]|jgi:uncharacterized protein YjfI (DUF2170 family)|nr:DUF2170 domain-containing protein [Comamonas sp. JNW]
MDPKTSAHYQRLHRQRLREQGLVKKEVWVLPEYSAALHLLEKQMRQPQAQPGSLTIHRQEGSMESSKHHYRSIQALADELGASALAREGKLQIELLEGAETSVLVTLSDFGDLPVHVALSGEQLVVEAFLWPANQVRDSAGLNAQILRLQKLFPFTTMALEPLTRGGEGYVMFAAMRANSSTDDILAEILILADSVIQATEALAPYLTLAQV